MNESYVSSTDQSPAVDAAAYDHVVITHTEMPGKSSWSRRRSIFTGVVAGIFFGIIFFGAYGATSAWICSARLDCGHWAPITIVSAIGVAGSAFVGGIAGYVMNKLYRTFKVV